MAGCEVSRTKLTPRTPEELTAIMKLKVARSGKVQKATKVLRATGAGIY